MWEAEALVWWQAPVVVLLHSAPLEMLLKTLLEVFDLLRSLDSVEMFLLLCGGTIATSGVVWIGLR